LAETLDTQALQRTATEAERWLDARVLTLATLEQLAAVAVCCLAAVVLAPRLEASIRARLARDEADPAVGPVTRSLATGLADALLPLTLPGIWLLAQWLSLIVARQAGWPHEVIGLAVSLLAAWVAIHLLSKLIRDPFWSRAARFAAWSVVALHIVGLLDEVRESLEKLRLTFGQVAISPLDVFAGIAWLAVLLWLATRATRLLERRIEADSTLSPAVQMLFTRLVKVGLIVAAVFISLGSIGIDLTALAVFSGAVGVGIGFGLQAIFNNFVAGIILLGERSLKVGDFVELERGLAGTVRRIAIRNTVLTTPDNVDIAVPNSEFVNGRMTNWTMLDEHARIHVPFPVAYGTDPELVERIVLDAARRVAFTLPAEEGRTPQVWLVRFGESRMDYELVVWLTAEGVRRPAGAHAAYCRAIYGTLRLHGLELPFPQRDLHLRSAVPLTVAPGDGGRTAGDPRRTT